jgi:hypothetical protein
MCESVWCSQRDIANSMGLALAATKRPGFDICYAISDNKYRWVDLDHARERLGYVPEDSAEGAATDQRDPATSNNSL